MYEFVEDKDLVDSYHILYNGAFAGRVHLRDRGVRILTWTKDLRRKGTNIWELRRAVQESFNVKRDDIEVFKL